MKFEEGNLLFTTFDGLFEPEAKLKFDWFRLMFDASFPLFYRKDIVIFEGLLLWDCKLLPKL